jgi:hypothetical protein
VKYFHGGYGGLRVGDVVLPPKETGAPSLSRFGMRDILREDQVYITTDETAARVFAALHHTGRGRAYEVEPIGPIAHDEDATGVGYSFRCPRARVVRVIQLGRQERADIITAMLATSEVL